jgi:hypothetical protein
MKYTIKVLFLSLGITCARSAEVSCQWANLKFSGIPDDSRIVFALRGDRCVVVNTIRDAPRLWMGVLQNNVFSGNEIELPAEKFASYWSWRPEITGVVTAYDKFYISSSGGIFEVADDGTLVSFWEWHWDTSANLRVNSAGQMLWRVRSFGSQSGSHFYSSETGFQAQYWWGGGSNTDPFGWWDIRGLVWGGTNTPPLLLSYSGYSTNGGTTYVDYESQASGRFGANLANSDLANRKLLAVNRDDGHLLYSDLEAPPSLFGDLNVPVPFPSVIAFLENSQIVAGDQSSTNYWLGSISDDSSLVLSITPPTQDSSEVNIIGKPGVEYVLEIADVLSPPHMWLPIATNAIPPSGAALHTVQSKNRSAFYRARLQEPSHP